MFLLGAILLVVIAGLSIWQFIEHEERRNG